VSSSTIGSAGAQWRAATSLWAELSGSVAAASRMVRTSATGRFAQDPSELHRGTLPGPPVMLVHGLGANKTSFRDLERFLHRMGHTVYGINYPSLGSDIAACGNHLAREAAWLREQTGSDQIHVVAHSLGGVVLRWAVAHTPMADWVRVAITLGSPHRGTPLACIAPAGLPGFGKVIRELRPGPAGAVRDALLGSGVDTVRWVAVAARKDWVVPLKYALLPEGDNVRNVVVTWGGHVTLPNSSQCLHVVLEELAAANRGSARDTATVVAGFADEYRAEAESVQV
jgi:triacylglycerol lipase